MPNLDPVEEDHRFSEKLTRLELASMMGALDSEVGRLTFDHARFTPVRRGYPILGIDLLPKLRVETLHVVRTQLFVRVGLYRRASHQVF